MTNLVVWSADRRSPVPLVCANAEGAQTRLFLFRDDPTNLCAGVPLSGTWTPDSWAKLEALIDYPNKCKNVAWPLELLFDLKDRTTPVAFAMNRLRGRPLSHLVIPAERAREKLNWDKDDFLQAATNLAILYAKLERMALTQADNHGGNYLLDWCPRTKRPRAVSRVDALSFGFHSGGRYFASEMAAWEFLPPELHGKTLAREVLTRQHDRFSLGVWMFTLLTGGYPWAFAGAGAATAADRVRERQFAMLSTPPGATVPKAVEDAFMDLPTETLVLLERALLGASSQRPTPLEWVASLKGQGAVASRVGRRWWPVAWPALRRPRFKLPSYRVDPKLFATSAAGLLFGALLLAKSLPDTADARRQGVETRPLVLHAQPAHPPAPDETPLALVERRPIDPNAWEHLNRPKGGP